MKKVLYYFFITFSIFLNHPLSGQGNLPTLSHSTFLEMVLSQHPVAKQAELMLKSGQWYIIGAKGNFDPKINAFFERKSFDGKNYFNNFFGEVSIPLSFGPNIKINYERNDGLFLNQDQLLPEQGLIHPKIEIPLIQGLLNDQRRTDLKIANLMQDITVQEQIIMLNELIYNASKSYLNWQYHHSVNQVVQQTLNLAQNRFELAKIAYETGDTPALDTLESYVNYTQRSIEYQESLQDYNISLNELNNFIWKNGTTPLLLDNTNIQPEKLNIASFELEVEKVAIDIFEIIENHPYTLQYNLDLKILELENDLNNELRKPRLSVGIGPLLQVSNDATFQLDNYKAEASLAHTFIQRKQKSKIQLTKIKIENKQQSLNMLKADLQLQLTNTKNNQAAYLNQHNTLIDNIAQMTALFEAELIKFDLSESTLFLVNSRENKLLAYQIKNAKLIKNLLQSRLEYLYYSNSLLTKN